MSLHPNWRAIIAKDWILFLATLLTGCEAVISAFDLADWGIPPTLKAIILFIVVAGAFLARLVVLNGRKE